MKPIALILACLFLLACGQRAEKQPWVILCDKNGNYTFTDETGGLWDLDVFTSKEEAVRHRDSIRRVTETIQREVGESEPLRKTMQARKWEACPK